MTEPYRIKAQLNCGAIITISQQEPGMNMVIELEPRPGVSISDAAEIKDNKLIIRSTIESLAGVYALLRSMAGETPRKKFLGIF